MVVIGLLLFVIVCELAAIYDRQNGGTSVPELHQWLRACKRENARKKSQGHNGTKKQAKDLHI